MLGLLLGLDGTMGTWKPDGCDVTRLSPLQPSKGVGHSASTKSCAMHSSLAFACFTALPGLEYRMLFTILTRLS